MQLLMDNVALVRNLEKSQLSVFTTQQLAIMMQMNVASATVKLNRLVKKGVLIRIIQGRYILPSADILSIASSIYPPSYISLLAAYEYYGTTTQTPRIIDVINTQRSTTLSLSLETGKFNIRFIKVDRSLMYGYNKIIINGKATMIAEKEKSIIDGLIFSRYVPLDEVFSCIQSISDHTKTIQYAILSKRQTIMKRLGYLLSVQNIKCSPKNFPHLSKTYVPLDPRHPRQGKYEKTWRIIINKVIE